MPLKFALTRISTGHELTTEEAESVMHALLRGDSPPEQTAGLLMGLRARGETIEELAAFARVMRQYAIPVRSTNPNTIDIVGTGGDHAGSFNISTAAMFAAAGAGASVAKHGNRSVSSMCGSADVLEALGVRIDLSAAGVEACLRETGTGFMFAPLFHPALRFVMPVRRALGVRTIFNILGPLCNPAGVKRGVFGAFSGDVAETSAEILARLGSEHVFAVHSEDGLDEFSPSAATRVFEQLRRETPVVHSVRPEDVGLTSSPLDSVRGGKADVNAEILRAVLAGRTGPYRDVVILNAAFALVAAGVASTPIEGAERAAAALDDGSAARTLSRLVDASRSHGD